MIPPLEELLTRYRKGDTRALAKLITLCENGDTRFVDDIEERDHHVIGVTGSPGVGKSSLIDRLASRYAEAGEKTAVVAIDPTSPFTHGAFLGDRVRMKRLASMGVFIRSMSSSNNTGGLTSSITDVLRLLSGFGFSKIFLETVGIGQGEVEVTNVADTVILVLSPDFGDEIQLFKAGIIEAADIYVVNKADLSTSKRLSAMLKDVIRGTERSDGWKKKVVETSCVEGYGFENLEKLVEDHIEYLKRSGELSTRRTRRRKFSAMSRFFRYVHRIVEKMDPNSMTFDGLKSAICSSDDIIFEKKAERDYNKGQGGR